MKKYILGAILVLAIIVFAVYTYLGGAEELTFTQVEQKMWFQGEAFRGRYSNPKIEDLFFKAREKAQANEQYSLAVINYKAPTDTVDQLVGIVSANEISEQIDYMFTSKVIEGKFLTTTIRAHNLVMPKPEDVMLSAQTYATKNDLTVDTSWTLEVYKDERKLQVFIPITD